MPALTKQHGLPALRLHGALVADVYRQLGTEYADTLFAKILDGDAEDGALEDVTWGRLLDDAYQVAAVLGSRFPDPRAARTVGLLAASGYTYYVQILACWLNNWTVQLLSTRNSLAGLESLLNAVNTTALIVDHTFVDMGSDLQGLLPDLVLLPIQKPPPYRGPASSEREEGRSKVEHLHRSEEELDRIIAYTHTSGSQGHPKPISVSHRHLLSDVHGRVAIQHAGAPFYSPSPLYHEMGFYSFTRWPLGSGLIPTFVQTRQPYTGVSVLRHLKALPGAVVFLTPVLLEEALRDCPGELKVLAACKRVVFAGAPIDPRAAEALIEQGVPIVAGYGSTEVGMLSDVEFPSEEWTQDWRYLCFSRCGYKLHFIPVEDSSPPVFELTISPGRLSRPAVINSQNPVGFKVDDYWEAHPTRPGLWKHAGRKGAVTVLSNGEKTDNRQLECLLTEDPRIKHVVVFGTGRPMNGVLLSRKRDLELSPAAFLDAIWPAVERANGVVPRHSRLLRPLVLVAAADKPFATTDKGTVRTKETLALYAREIDAAYAAVEAAPGGGAPAVGAEDVLPLVRAAVQKLVERPIDDDDDVFDAGLDSLHAVQIRVALLPLVSPYVPSLPHNIVYANPTIERLAAALTLLRGGSDDSAPEASPAQEKATRIEDCIDRFSSNFYVPSARRAAAPADDGYVVALTGATGSLGCQLLQELLGREDVRRVVCLHRAAAAAPEARQKAAFEERGIPLDRLLRPSKVEYLAVDLAQPTLGLQTEALSELRSSVTHIVHTAWELNFNWPLARFERVHIAGVRHLIDLAMASPRAAPPRLIFLSSIAAVGKCAPAPAVAERAFGDAAVAIDRGYGEAKYVAERVLDRAAAAGLRATVVRAGQLAGASGSGHWNPAEYVPIMVRSCQALRAIPQDLPDVRWLPTDVAARCVAALTLRDEPAGAAAYYHLENPTPTPWARLMAGFSAALGGGLAPVPMEEWLARVAKAGASVPAASLVHFFSDMGNHGLGVTLGVERSREVCPEVEYGEVGEELVGRYAAQMRVAA